MSGVAQTGESSAVGLDSVECSSDSEGWLEVGKFGWLEAWCLLVVVGLKAL